WRTNRCTTPNGRAETARCQPASCGFLSELSVPAESPRRIGYSKRMAIAVTTSGKASAELIARARQAAKKWGLPFIERKRKAPLGALFGPEAHALLVFGAEGLALWDREGALRFTPGMARLRVKRLDAGIQEDLLVRIAGFQAGETVLDCTL